MDFLATLLSSPMVKISTSLPAKMANYEDTHIKPPTPLPEVFHMDADDDEPRPVPGTPKKRKRGAPDADLDAALARMFPKKEPYNVKTAHITSGNEWHPTNPPTARSHIPIMPKAPTVEKKVHLTVLDFLVDIMRNAHWRGTLSSPPQSKHDSNSSIWPRANHAKITKIIIDNPFLHRLARMLESRFYLAAAGQTTYVPSVAVHGEANQSVPLEPRYIAGILIQALGVPNLSPCALCCGEWNAPAASILEEDPPQVRAFKNCISLENFGLPARFKACGNHFWIGAVSDCACVLLDAPLHPDERYEYFWREFDANANNKLVMRKMLDDDWCKVVSEIPGEPSVIELPGQITTTSSESELISNSSGERIQKIRWIQFGPFLVRADLVNGRDGRLFKFAVDQLAGVAQEIVQSRGSGDVDVESEGWRARIKVLKRL